jgi:DNA transformation protein and related proteins
MDPEALQDLFQDFGSIRIRNMFGGQGIYRDEVMFALVSDGEIYLKVDEASRPAFAEAGSRPFVYEKDGRAVEMSYWLMPEAGFDDPGEAARWARLGLAAAVRAEGRRRPAPRRGRQSIFR